MQADFKCFACDRAIKRKQPLEADTRDGQTVFVGAECHRLIVAAGDAGYQPPKGGPRLYPLAGESTFHQRPNKE